MHPVHIMHGIYFLWPRNYTLEHCSVTWSTVDHLNLHIYVNVEKKQNMTSQFSLFQSSTVYCASTQLQNKSRGLKPVWSSDRYELDKKNLNILRDQAKLDVNRHKFQSREQCKSTLI